MSNVVHLKVPSPGQRRAGRRGALIAAFATHRRYADDVFWLKENAELLNILECTGARPDAGALAPHEGFYARIERQMGFFPQYFRFLLSICLDLEDLGLPGDKAAALCHWAAGEGLAEAELSDLQRAEAVRLMARRGIDPLPHDTGLDARLHAFMDRSETFAMPNKKAAYELTHIVFYLSEYGRRDPGLSRAARLSLEYAGLLAFLDRNADLLAEVCVAMRHAGMRPPAGWETWLRDVTRGFIVSAGDAASGAPRDDYHTYLVCNWLLAAAGREPFAAPVAAGPVTFARPAAEAMPLRELSQVLFRLEDGRCDDWHAMRATVMEALSAPARTVLQQAEASTARFDSFFAGFARTGLRGVRL